MFASLWSLTKQIFAFADNFLTTVLGLVALWGLIRHRREIALVMRVFIAGHLNERLKKVRETLTKLENLSYDNKEERAEIAALFGQIAGQIRPLVSNNEDLNRIHNEISGVMDRRIRLSEALKRKIVFELHGSLDDFTLSEVNKFLQK